MGDKKDRLTKACQRIHKNAVQVLFEAGFRVKTPEIRKILEDTGQACFDETTGHIHILPDYTQWCLEQAPKKLKVDPGLNSFGTGGCLRLIEDRPAVHGAGEIIKQELRPVTYQDVEWALRFISENRDVIKFSDIPIAPPSADLFRIAQISDDNLPRDFLKGLSVAEMKYKEVKKWARRDCVHIFCGVQSPLTEIPEKMSKIPRSARIGAVLAFSSMPMGGMNAPQSTEGLVTLCHAEILFMIVLAQTVNPGVTCIHYGYPCPTRNYDMQFGSLRHALDNALMARVNLEVTKLPCCHTGGASAEPHFNWKSLEDGVRCRSFFRHNGFHMIRHSLGSVANTNYWNPHKLILDVELEREKRGDEKIDIDFLDDEEVVELILRNGSQPLTYRDDPHTLKHIGHWFEGRETRL